MKEEFEKYLVEINIPASAKERINCILEEIGFLYENLAVNDIFVSQVKGSTLNYTSLWLFGVGFCMECKNFLSQDDFDLAYLNSNVSYMRYTKDNAEGREFSEESILSFYAQIGNMSCSLTAVGKNCTYAIDIAKKYYFRNSLTKHYLTSLAK